MPCRGPESEDELLPSELKSIGAASRQPEIDKLTRMLCSLCKYVDEYTEMYVDCLTGYVENELIDWWNEHQKLDEKRKEQLKERALAKLTKEEKEVLGL